MRKMGSCLSAVCIAAILLACAHTDPSASTSTGSAVISPEVHADHTVTLRLKSSSAGSVTASGDIGILILSKDASGVWSVTTAPLEPAIYTYSFSVDGVPMADPGNPDVKGTTESLVTVPGDPPMPWELRNVPHGRVSQVLSQSQAFGTTRRWFIYTPPTTEPAAEALPVLYLLHGYTDDDSTWTAVGKAHIIADNLLADGRIKPLIIVMPYGQRDSRVTVQEAFAPDFQERLERQLFTEIIPCVEKPCNAAPDAKHRAIAGNSMGGMQAAFIGMNHPETFSTVGAWSSAIFVDLSSLLSPLAAAPDNLKRSFLYIHVGVGQDDPLISGSRAIDRFLSTQGIPHEFTPTAGAHSWMVWRSYLVDFLQKFSSVSR